MVAKQINARNNVGLEEALCVLATRQNGSKPSMTGCVRLTITRDDFHSRIDLFRALSYSSKSREISRNGKFVKSLVSLSNTIVDQW